MAKEKGSAAVAEADTAKAKARAAWLRVGAVVAAALEARRKRKVAKPTSKRWRVNLDRLYESRFTGDADITPALVVAYAKALRQAKPEAYVMRDDFPRARTMRADEREFTHWIGLRDMVPEYVVRGGEGGGTVDLSADEMSAGGFDVEMPAEVSADQAGALDAAAAENEKIGAAAEQAEEPTVVK